MHTLIIILSLIMAALTAPILALASTTPEPGRPVLVVSKPGAALREAMIARAGGQIIEPLPGLLGSLAVFDRADFRDRLRKDGAWLVTDGRIIARLCGG